MKVNHLVFAAFILGGVLSFSSHSDADMFAVERTAYFLNQNEIVVDLTITGDPAAIAALQALGLEEYLPEGWSYAGLYSTNKSVSVIDLEKSVNVTPRTDRIEFYWIDIPEFPIRLAYKLTITLYNSGQFLSGKLFALTAIGNYDIDLPTTFANTIPCLEMVQILENAAYVPGGEVSLQVNISSYCRESVQTLEVIETLSAPWTLVEREVTYPGFVGAPPEVTMPAIGEQSPLHFVWQNVPIFPLSLKMKFSVPTTSTAAVTMESTARYRLSGPDLVSTAPGVSISRSAAGVLAGMVRHSVTTLPLSDVLVTVSPGNYQTTTGITGVFFFANVPVGNYTITATRADFVTYTDTVTVTDIGALVDILMTPVQRGSLTGIVRSAESGLPISGVQVSMAGKQDTTNLTGLFRIEDIPVGSYTISATCSGFQDYRGNVTINSGENALEILMSVQTQSDGEGEQTLGSLNGIVRNKTTGLPVANAKVTLFPGGYESMTPWTGIFSFSNIPIGQYTIKATCTGYEVFSQSVTVTQGVGFLEITLTPIPNGGENEGEGEGEGEREGEGEGELEGEVNTWGNLSGHVRNATTNQPLKDVSLFLSLGDYQTLSDSKGAYEFNNIPVGTYMLTATLVGYEIYGASLDIVAGVNTHDVLLKEIGSGQEGEGEIEQEGEIVEGEGEGEGEDTVDGCDNFSCSCLSSINSKRLRHTFGDFFIIGMGIMVLIGLKRNV